jgi:tRNA-guanine family transglycosylase
MDSARSEEAVNSTKKLFKRAGSETTMLDSGGFQIIRAENNNKKKKMKLTMTFDSSLPLMRSKSKINISPFHVVDAACKLRPSIMTALDFPIAELSDRRAQEKEFRRKLELNMKWARETASLREERCPRIQLFIPVQCYNLDHFETFWNSIEGIRYDGLSLPIRNLGYSELALFLLSFYQIGVRKVHILGSSSFFTIALAAFFARNFFEWVSFDATTWREQAQNQKYLNPYNLSARNLRSDLLIDERLPMMCHCPFCTNMTFTDIKNLPYTDKVHFLRNHNFYVTEELTQEMFEEAGTWLTLEGFLRQRSRRKKEIAELITCLSMVDLLRDKDINVLKPIFKVAA